MYRERIESGSPRLFEPLIGKVIRVETDHWERVGIVDCVTACDVQLYGPNREDEGFCTSFNGPFLVTTVEDRWTGPGPEPLPIS